MSASHAFASSTYQNVSVDSGVAAADPHGLISMLLSGAIERAGAARIGLMNNDYRLASDKLGTVAAIISELRSSLDHKQGGALAADLDQLYDYMLRRTLHATRHRDQDAVLEVMDLLAQLYSAWLEISPA